MATKTLLQLTRPQQNTNKNIRVFVEQRPRLSMSLAGMHFFAKEEELEQSLP